MSWKVDVVVVVVVVVCIGCVFLLFFLLLLLSVHRRRHSFPITQRAKRVAVTADSMEHNAQTAAALRIGSTLVGWTGKFESPESVVCVRATRRYYHHTRHTHDEKRSNIISTSIFFSFFFF